MSKNSLNEIVRDDLFKELKKLYQHNNNIYVIDAILQAEGLETYTIANLTDIYNNLGTDATSTIDAIYNNPQKALPEKQASPEQLNQCFVEFSQIYIREYLALEILLKMGVYSSALFEMMGARILLADALYDLLAQTPTIHIKTEESEEKHFQAEASSDHTPALAPDPVIEAIKTLKASDLYNPIEILVLISEQFPDSITFVSIKEMEAAGISISEAFDNLLLGNNK